MAEIGHSGFLNFNKPLHLTSHDVVAQVRKRYRALSGSKKVGHAGTLDPLANGVLVICLGDATRLSEYVMQSRKVYRAEITLGVSTSTYDAAGEITARQDARQIELADVRRVLPQFIGDIEQIPPMYSAIKHKGRKLYELARQGKTIERPARPVSIGSIEIFFWKRTVMVLEIECGAGTYIRSLAHDLGQALGVGAYLSGLTRLASGSFKLGRSINLEAVQRDDDWLGHIIQPYDALRDHPQVTLTSDEIERIRHGQFIDQREAIDSPILFAFDADRQLAAVLQPRDKLWKPHKVFLKQN